jgi:hypothetical protein
VSDRGFIIEPAVITFTSSTSFDFSTPPADPGVLSVLMLLHFSRLISPPGVAAGVSLSFTVAPHEPKSSVPGVVGLREEDCARGEK